MKVSVITVYYNAADTLKETMGSILGQTYKDIEYLVIDNGSSDESKSIVDSFKDPRIKYIRIEKNTGSPVAGRNIGIKEAAGELIGLCDDDDIWYPEKIEKQVKAYLAETKKGNKVGLIATTADIVDVESKVIGKRPLPLNGLMKSKDAFRALLLDGFLTACSILFNREILVELGGLDEDRKGNDDYDIELKIAQKYDLLFVDEPLCGWRKTPGQMSGNSFKIYLENEKIFSTIKDKRFTKEISFAHGRNLSRMLIVLLSEKNYKEALEYNKKLERYPISAKMKFVSSLTKLNPGVTRLLIQSLIKLNLFSK
jgi:glycosyltransferase involved in cell wall biosynthesis